MSEIEVKRFAIKYDPPTLVVEYKKYNKDSQIWKTFLKKIRIKNPENIDYNVLFIYTKVQVFFSLF